MESGLSKSKGHFNNFLLSCLLVGLNCVNPPQIVIYRARPQNKTILGTFASNKIRIMTLIGKIISRRKK